MLYASCCTGMVCAGMPVKRCIPPVLPSASFVFFYFARVVSSGYLSLQICMVLWEARVVRDCRSLHAHVSVLVILSFGSAEQALPVGLTHSTVGWHLLRQW